MARKEFGKRVRAQAFKRCGGPDHPKCEGCSQPLQPGKFQFDHIVPDGLGGEPTLENCKVLCSACHTEKTEKQDKPVMRKADAQQKAHWGLNPKGSIPQKPKMRREPKSLAAKLPPLPKPSLYRKAS